MKLLKSLSTKTGSEASGHFQKWQDIFLPFVPYLISFFFLWISFYHVYRKNVLNNETAICLCMRTILLVLVLYGVIQAYKKNLTMEHLIWLCILGGLVMRIGYALYTPYYVRFHDLGQLSDTDVGHASYIYNLYVHHTLPASYDYQFYQPPLYYILAVTFMKIFSFLNPEADFNTLFPACNLVSCFASCSSLFLVYRICQKLTCTKEMTCLIVGLIAFHPSFYLLGGTINNDATAVALMLFSCLMLLEWYQSRSLSHLVGLALGIGLGMMAKLNVAIMAFVAGPVMLYVFWQSIRQKTWKKLCIHYVIFLVVSVPLGLWYSFRNLILFGQPLGYVHNIDAEANTILYRGDYPLAQRFLPFTLSQLKQGIYTDTPNDYNIPLYVLRSSLFGEYPFSNVDTAARILLYLNLLLIILSLAAMIVIIWKGREFSPALRFGCGFFWLIQMISFVIFNLKFPDSCTMDFRYIVPTCVCGSIYLAAFWQKLRNYSHQKEDGLRHFCARYLSWLIPVFCIGFALASAYMYCNLS